MGLSSILVYTIHHSVGFVTFNAQNGILLAFSGKHSVAIGCNHHPSSAFNLPASAWAVNAQTGS